MSLKVWHANATRVYDIGEIDGQHFISMEYIDGEDLSSLLRRIGRLPKNKAVQMSHQLCAGLAAAHDQGVLHRDLKPANVMIVALTRLLVRKTWLAVGLCLLLSFFILWPSAASPLPHLIGTPLFLGLFFIVLFRFGFLAIAASVSTLFLVNEMPITPDPSSWYFSSTIFTLALIAALALYGFKITLPRRVKVRNSS